MTPTQTHAAHWYCIDKMGMATLCVDQDDAQATATDSQTLYPHNGPYRAVQLAPVSQETAQAGELPEPDAVFYCSEDTGYLTQYRRPPANLTDGDVAMYEADTVRSLLISAALASRKPFTPAQRMRLWQNTEKGKSATSLDAFERIVQTTEAAHRIGINGLEVKP